MAERTFEDFTIVAKKRKGVGVPSIALEFAERSFQRWEAAKSRAVKEREMVDAIMWFGAARMEAAQKGNKGLWDVIEHSRRYAYDKFGIRENPVSKGEGAAIGAGAGALLLGPIGAIAGGYVGAKKGGKKKKDKKKGNPKKSPKKDARAKRRAVSRLLRGT
jgi:hypothetical protein